MDHSQPNRRLSEISHLFLSDVRDKTPGGERPKRTPPGGFRKDVSIDLTPEEFAKVFGGDGEAAKSQSAAFKPVRAVIAHHLGEIMADRIRDLATTMGTRTGVIYADAANVRICCIDRSVPQPARGDEHEPDTEALDARKLEEVIVELDQDVSNWIVVLPDPRQTEAAALLRMVKHWTLLSGVDHDAVVAGYRTIKGLCETARPALSVAVFGATDEDELHKTYRKLASVCEQFLKVDVGLFGATEPSDAAHGCVMTMSDASTTAGDAPAAHWRVLGKLINEAEAVTPLPAEAAAESAAASDEQAFVPQEHMTPVMLEIPAPAKQIPAPVAASVFAPISGPAPAAVTAPLKLAQASDTVIDLNGSDTTAPAILAAVVRGGGEWVESPIKAPACPDAIVAVSRDRRLVLLAVAKQGLNEIRTIAKAYNWLTENRQLVSMALPQFAIDAAALPRLQLLVDHADASAEALQPLLATGNVQATAYRTLRWGDRTGLLLDAA